MLNVCILGSTGSIGRQTLDVIAAHPDRFRLRSIAAFHNEQTLISQILSYKPDLCAFSRNIAVPSSCSLIAGNNAYQDLVRDPETDIVVIGISGFAALPPLLAALYAGKRVALANKESIVCGGSLVQKALETGGGVLLPVDSEQSAIFQCLQMGRKDDVEKLILTASGGPFYQRTREELASISPEQAVAHPTWSMGRKISLDSATMFNKGLEIMEAAGLFGFSGEKIEVLIHPQSIVHSMVAYIDGSVAADLSVPDMRIAIQYALTWPDRISSPARKLSFTELGGLTFFKPSFERFPALSLAYDCLSSQKGYPVVYNAANEVAADAFFTGRIRFDEIEECVQAALEHFSGCEQDSLEAVMETDRIGRTLAANFIEQIVH